MTTNKHFCLTSFFVSYSLFNLFSVPLSWAEYSQTSRWGFGIHPGLSLPGGNTNDLQKESFYMQATGEYFLKKPYSIGFEFGQALGHKSEGILVADVDGDGGSESVKVRSDSYVDVYQSTLFIKAGGIDDWGTWSPRAVRRYFILGAGLYRTVGEGGSFFLSGKGSSGLNLVGRTYPIQSSRDNDFGINFGLGLEVQVWTHYRAGFDMRYHWIFRKPKRFDYYLPSLRFGRLF